MADLERFGGELFLNASQYISTVGRVASANVRLEQSLQKTGNAVTEMGLKFDKGIKGAEQFGKMRDLGTGRIVAGLGAINKAIDVSVRKYAQLSESGRESHRKLADSLAKLQSAENTYKSALENVLKATIKAAEAGDKDRDAKEKVNKAVRTAQNVYRTYLKTLNQVNNQQSKINRENNAIIASYQILGQRLAATTSKWTKLSGIFSAITSKLAPLRRALGAIKTGLTGAGAGAASAGGLIGVLGAVAGGAGVAIGALSTALGAVGKAFKFMLSPIHKVVNALKNFFKVASQIAVGILIRDTIRSLVRELRELAFAGFEAVTFFQALEIRLDLMELRALRAEGATASLSDMMQMAGDRAIRLTHWIKVLSLTSPFTVETLATVTSLNLAMGFTEDMSKRLTIAIADYTAGMGLSNQVMERIVFNFGQMKSAGKVTGTEMRDLARGAFLPLTDVLNEAARLMGVVTDDIMEFRKAAAEGAVDVDTFFRAFINVVERDFGDATKRFARTLTGVQNRLANFMKTVIGLEVLGPVAARFAEIASNALDGIMKPEVIERARLLGISVLRAFDLIRNKAQALSISLGHLWKALGLGTPTFESMAFAVAKFTFWMRAAIDLVRGVVQKITSYFEDMGETLVQRMGRYGYNIIAVFAKGMARALVLVVRVLTWLARAITGLLAPGSPPKLLPDLPKWGMAAMAEYLRGFTLVDFDVLEGIQDPIKDALDILEETGKIGANQAGKIFAEISKSIAKALATGKIDEKLFARIAKITGPFGQEIAQLARRQVELAAATEDVRKAEIRLDQARKSHSSARVKTNSLIREYNKSLREGADPSFLKAKLAEINASERAAQAAYEEQKAAEGDLEQKEASLKVVSELLELQERLVSQLLELTRAQIVQPELDEAAAGAGEEIGDEDAFPELPPLPEIELPDEEAIAKQIDAIFEAARLEVEKSIAELKAAFEETGLMQAFAGLSTAWGDAWTSITTFYDGKVQPILDRIVIWWQDTWPGITDNLENISNMFKNAWATFTETLDDVNERLEELGIDKISIKFEDILNVITAAILGIGYAAGALAFVLGFIVSTVLGGLITAGARIAEGWAVVQEGWDKIVEAWENFRDQGFSWDFVGDLLTGLGEVILGIIATIVGGVAGFFEGMILTIIDFFTNLWHKLVGGSIIPEMMDDIYDAITKPLEDIAEFWNEKWQSLTDWWYNTLEPAIDDVVSWFIDLKDDIISSYNEMVNNAFEPFRVFFEEKLPAAWQTFKAKVDEVWTWFETNIITPIRNFIDGEIEDLRAAIAETLTNAFDTFKTSILEPLAAGFDAVKDAVGRLWDKVIKLKDSLLAFPFKLLEMWMGRSPSPLSIGIDAATRSLQKMATTALPQVSKQLMMLQSSGMANAPVMSAPSVMGSTNTSRSVQVNMGGVNINSAMDEAVFEARVLDIVQKGLRI